MGLFSSGAGVGAVFGGAAGALTGGLFGGGKNPLGSLFGTDQGVINTQGSNTPWAPLEPYLLQGFQGAQNLYQGFQPQTQGLDQARSTLGATAAGNFLTPDSNPYLKSSVQDALGLAGSAFAGQYGGSAGNNLDNTGYQEGLARTLGNVATNAYSNAYGQERQNQLQAAQSLPALDMQAMQAPWAGLQNYMAALSPGLGFNQTTNQSPYFQNNTANTLGMLAGGAGIAKMFSDRRLKSNIVKVGQDSRGFGIYDYEIFGIKQRGVMADEVEKIIPEAVSEYQGYKMVDYARL